MVGHFLEKFGIVVSLVFSNWWMSFKFVQLVVDML